MIVRTDWVTILSVEGFTLRGPRVGDWRVASGLVALAGFSMAFAALYGSALALVWPIPLVLLAAHSLQRWYSSPRVELVVDGAGVRYSLGASSAPIVWSSIRLFEKRPLGGRDCVLVVLADGDEFPLDPGALGLVADDLLRMLDSCRRAAVSSPSMTADA